MFNRIWILSVNYFLMLLSPIWVTAFFAIAFFTTEEFKSARRGEGYLLK